MPCNSTSLIERKRTCACHKHWPTDIRQTPALSAAFVASTLIRMELSRSIQAWIRFACGTNGEHHATAFVRVQLTS